QVRVSSSKDSPLPNSMTCFLASALPVSVSSAFFTVGSPSRSNRRQALLVAAVNGPLPWSATRSRYLSPLTLSGWPRPDVGVVGRQQGLRRAVVEGQPEGGLARATAVRPGHGRRPTGVSPRRGEPVTSRGAPRRSTAVVLVQHL